MKKATTLLLAGLSISGCADASGLIAPPEEARRATYAVSFEVRGETWEYSWGHYSIATFVGGEVVVGVEDANGTVSNLGTAYADNYVYPFTQPAGSRAFLSSYAYGDCVFLYWEANLVRVYDPLIYVDDHAWGPSLNEFMAIFQCPERDPWWQGGN